MSYLYHTTLYTTLKEIRRDGLLPQPCPGHGLTRYAFLTTEGRPGWEEALEYWFAAAESVAEQEETRAVVLRVRRDILSCRLFIDQPGTRCAGGKSYKVKKLIPAEKFEWSYSPAGPWSDL